MFVCIFKLTSTGNIADLAIPLEMQSGFFYIYLVFWFVFSFRSNPKIIPFRESKLTRLFQSFFMGKGKASMIVNVNQCASGFDETIHVLKFSAIAKQVIFIRTKICLHGLYLSLYWG